jgi:hypothetical protein
VTALTLHFLEMRDIQLAILTGEFRRRCRREPAFEANVLLHYERAIIERDDAVATLEDLRDKYEDAKYERDAAEDRCGDLENELDAALRRLRAYERLDDEIGREGACKGCGKPIQWAVSTDGPVVPLDLRPAVYRNTGRTTADGTPLVERVKGSAVTHFATCPKANEFTQPPAAEGDANG